MDIYQSVDGLGPPDRSQDLRGFMGVVMLAQAAGLVAIVLVSVWVGHMNGGFGWTEGQVFNYHPLFMVIGMVFMYGDAILMYRIFRHNRKISIKILHAVMHILALVFGIIGLKAVFASHSFKDAPNMKSLHSWMGLTVVIGFAAQWLIGFLTFLFPKFREDTRSNVLKWHTGIGTLMFALVIGTAFMGITEFNMGHANQPSTVVMGNMVGIVLAIFGAAVLFLVTKQEYRRVEPLEDERIILKD